jgi:subtilase family serine protease
MLFVFNTAGVPAVAKIISIGPSLPDLIPTSLSYASKFGLFTVVVKNQGTAATPAGVDIGNSFYVGGTRVTWGIVPGPLAPGASVTINSLRGGAYTISPGKHTIGVLVDDVDRIAESNKNNNRRGGESITVP